MLKNHLFFFLLFSLFLLKGFSQIEKTTTQVGVSVLPVFDILQLVPDNKISGLAVSGNIGYHTIKNMSVGINPYYAEVVNSYPSDYSKERERQNIKLYGLNTYLRYYIINRAKFLAYSFISLGFGAFEQKTFNASTRYLIETNINPVFILQGGIGINYFVTERLALELNIPYTYVNHISTNPDFSYFHTVAPTIGLQFYWK
ncbi:MAG: outer membrane beta-barrel protein [Bacteroidota bacterium]